MCGGLEDGKGHGMAIPVSQHSHRGQPGKNKSYLTSMSDCPTINIKQFILELQHSDRSPLLSQTVCLLFRKSGCLILMLILNMFSVFVLHLL